MAKFSIQQLMNRLSVIPGLRFLEIWLTDYKTARTQYAQRVGDLQTYYRAAGEGVNDVRGAVGGGPAALDPNIDESGNFVGGEEEDSGYGRPGPSSDSASDPASRPQVDGLSQNYEDVFFDDGDL